MAGSLAFALAFIFSAPPVWDRLGRQIGMLRAFRRVAAPVLAVIGVGASIIAFWDTDEGKAFVANQKSSGAWCSQAIDEVERDVQANLRNPSSYQRVSAKIAPPAKDGWSSGFITYRAQNGFGGLNLEIVRFRVLQDDCSYQFTIG